MNFQSVDSECCYSVWLCVMRWQESWAAAVSGRGPFSGLVLILCWTWVRLSVSHLCVAQSGAWICMMDLSSILRVLPWTCYPDAAKMLHFKLNRFDQCSAWIGSSWPEVTSQPGSTPLMVMVVCSNKPFEASCAVPVYLSVPALSCVSQVHQWMPE